MYGAEWLIGLGLLALAAGLGGGYLLASRAGGGGRRRELEEQVAAARRELEDYRHEVVTQFSETARKFQTLNDSYTDLHQQLARSSSILCGEVSGPLLAAPAGHQDLIPAEIRDGGSNLDAERSEDGTALAEQPSPAADEEPTPAANEEPATRREPVQSQTTDSSANSPGSDTDGEAIRVAEPVAAEPVAADASAASGPEDSSKRGETPTAPDSAVESSRRAAGRS